MILCSQPVRLLASRVSCTVLYNRDSVKLGYNEHRKLHTTPSRSGAFQKYLGYEASVASPDYKNRWLMAAPAFLTHFCIGAPYAWSAMSGPLSKELGFVCSAAEDWSIAACTVPMSILFAFHGLTAAAVGKWQMKVGPRAAISAAAVCFGGGFLLSSVGIMTHSIPLMYLGYGVLGGIGLGLSYTPPIQALIEWFPDKKGLASGLTIMGFGSGALLFAPAANALMNKFSVVPEYLGSAVQTVTEGGRLFAEHGGALVEVVYANSADLAKLSVEGLSEGYYVVGTGNTGTAAALTVIGLGYMGAMLGSAFLLKKPHPSYKVEGFTGGTGGAVAPSVHTDVAWKLPQFKQLGIVLLCVASGGMGLISVAKPLMSEVFSGALPLVVTAGFASSFILMLSCGNLGGRLAWGALSDKIGRRATFNMFCLGSVGMYAAIPTIISQVVEHQSVLALSAFCGLSVMTISIMGGVYSILPAYESDLFGAKYVGANHGKMLLFSSTAALLGPGMILALRGLSEKNAINDLVAKIDPSMFLDRFGADVSQLSMLMETKTVTIAKLMELAPVGTMDPSPFLYNTTMYTVAGLCCIATLTHQLIKPVEIKYFEKE